MKRAQLNKVQQVYTGLLELKEKATKYNCKQIIKEMFALVDCKYSMKEQHGLFTKGLEIEWFQEWKESEKGSYDGYKLIITERFSNPESNEYSGDLRMLAEDLTMMYCRTNGINDFHNTYDMHHYLDGETDYPDYEIVIED